MKTDCLQTTQHYFGPKESVGANKKLNLQESGKLHLGAL